MTDNLPNMVNSVAGSAATVAIAGSAISAITKALDDPKNADVGQMLKTLVGVGVGASMVSASVATLGAISPMQTPVLVERGGMALSNVG